jgi:hypothetical protein
MMTEARRETIAALRREMPFDFMFAFDRLYQEVFIPETPEHEKSCGACGCVMGLIKHLNLVEMGDDDWRHHSRRDPKLALALGISLREVETTFYMAGVYKKQKRDEVTPQDVADRLEALP